MTECASATILALPEQTDTARESSLAGEFSEAACLLGS